MASGDVLKVTARGHAGAVKFVQTFHYEGVGGSGPPDLVGWSGNFELTVAATMMDILNNAYHGDVGEYTIIAGPNAGQQYINPGWTGFTGNVAGTVEDMAYSLIVRRGDGTANRHGRGRLFIGPITDTVFDPTGLLVAAPAAMAPFLGAITTSLVDGSGSTFAPCLYDVVTGNLRTISVSSYSPRAGIRKHRRYKV
jgi:hypothetical protein